MKLTKLFNLIYCSMYIHNSSKDLQCHVVSSVFYTKVSFIKNYFVMYKIYRLNLYKQSNFLHQFKRTMSKLSNQIMLETKWRSALNSHNMYSYK